MSATKSMITPGDRLELLETFIRIAETGGIGAAARSLDTTQPTVSRRLQQLEGLLDAKLIERSTQCLSLTAIGAALLPEARDVVARWRGLTETVGAETGAIHGVVRVIAPREFVLDLLPDIMVEFLARCPDVRVDLRASDDPVELAAEGADFALRLGKPASDVVMSREIARVRSGLYAAPDYAEALAVERGVEIERCEPAALEDAPLITSASAHGSTIRLVEEGGEISETRFHRVAAFDLAEPALRMAHSGLGLVLAPTWRAADYVADGLLTPVAGDWRADETPVCAVWTPDRFRSAAASTLLEMIEDLSPRQLAAH